MPEHQHVRVLFVFNHKYEKNLDKLRSLYGERFHDVRYLMPFYTGNRPDVIPVYESSSEFQGFFAQAARSFIDPKVTHYVFTADDLLLNPSLNDETIISAFGLGEGEAYIDGLLALSDEPLQWPHLLKALPVWRDEQYVMYKSELPSQEEAARRMASNGCPVGDLTWKNLKSYGKWKRYPGWYYHLKLMLKRKGRIKMPYPMVKAYSDVVIVPRASIEKFCHYCGVFAAMGLWVEVAIPTALALSCDKIVQTRETGRTGLAVWTAAEVEEIGRKADYDVHKVFSVIGNDQLYLHPVKLSKWKL